MVKYKIGDIVKVTLGKDSGRESKILKVFPKEGTALLEGVNMYKKHIKAQVAADGKGGVYDLPRPMVYSKFALICPNCKKITRVGVRVEGEDKVRFCKKCDRTIK